MKKILVSQCLYGGEPVRYDGRSKTEEDPRFLKWKEEGRLIPICPEVFGGLPVPRADAQRVGDQVIARTGKDVTFAYRKGAEEAVRLAKEQGVICAVMKEKSPSCGSSRIYDGTFEGTLIEGQGLATELLREAGFKVFSEEKLDEAEKMLEAAERGDAEEKNCDETNMFDGKKVIIFDMDGTLIDSVGIWNEVDRKLIEKLAGIAVAENEIQKERDDALRRYKTAPDPYGEYCRDLKERYGMSKTPEEIAKIRYEIAQKYLRDSIDYKEGAAEFIRELKKAGMVLAIASTTKRSNMDVYRTENSNIRRKASLDRYFSLVYTREDAREIKPSPELYLKVMETLGAKPSECLVFEDSLVGVEAAAAAGIETAVIYDRHSDGEREEIEAIADYIIGDHIQALDIFRKR